MDAPVSTTLTSAATWTAEGRGEGARVCVCVCVCVNIMPPKRKWTSSEKRSVGARQAWTCARCATLLPATFEVDHVHPLHKGGADCVETNAEALCNQCHARKTLDERMQFERLRAEAIQRAKAEAEAEADPKPSTSPCRPLLGNRPLLAPEPGLEVLENRFLKFAHVAVDERRRRHQPF